MQMQAFCHITFKINLTTNSNIQHNIAMIPFCSTAYDASQITEFESTNDKRPFQIIVAVVVRWSKAPTSFFCVRHVRDWGSSSAAALMRMPHSLWAVALGHSTIHYLLCLGQVSTLPFIRRQNEYQILGQVIISKWRW